MHTPLYRTPLLWTKGWSRQTFFPSHERTIPNRLVGWFPCRVRLTMRSQRQSTWNCICKQRTAHHTKIILSKRTPCPRILLDVPIWFPRTFRTGNTTSARPSIIISITTHPFVHLSYRVVSTALKGQDDWYNVQAKIHALKPAKPWSNNSFPKSLYSVCCEQYRGSSLGPADQ